MRRLLRGFTLTELLIVMGIMAILIGLIMPSLSQARRSSRRAACMSNLHQATIGLTNYLGDSRGWLPYFIPLSKDPWNPDKNPLLEALKRYVPDTRIFTCPADDTGVAEELGTSYDYWPGWIMWAREIFRGEDERTVVRVVTKFYEMDPRNWPILADAEPWHRPLDEIGKNATFWDGSVRALLDWSEPRWKR